MSRSLLPGERRAVTDSLRLVRELSVTLPELYAELIRLEDQDGSASRATDLMGAVSDQVQHGRLLLRLRRDEARFIQLLHLVVEPGESTGKNLGQFPALAGQKIDELRGSSRQRAW